MFPIESPRAERTTDALRKRATPVVTTVTAA
jgi:hypothetical protein